MDTPQLADREKLRGAAGESWEERAQRIARQSSTESSAAIDAALRSCSGVHLRKR